MQVTTLSRIIHRPLGHKGRQFFATLEKTFGKGFDDQAANNKFERSGLLGNKEFKHIVLKVTPKNVHKAFKDTPKVFDFFSLDIDSYDFEIAEKLLSLGWQPKTVCLEFNPKFGPTAHASFPFRVGKKIFNKKKEEIAAEILKEYEKLVKEEDWLDVLEDMGYRQEENEIFFQLKREGDYKFDITKDFEKYIEGNAK